MSVRRSERVLFMGTIIEFPADAASRRQVSGSQASGSQGIDGGPREAGSYEAMGTVLILPVIRIEREPDETSGGRGPEGGTAPGRRRRRR
jgi:hypothetical protein